MSARRARLVAERYAGWGALLQAMQCGGGDLREELTRVLNNRPLVGRHGGGGVTMCPIPDDASWTVCC